MTAKSAYTLTLVTGNDHYQQVERLFRAYAAHIGIDLQFQHFTEELLSLRQMYAPENGGIILAEKDGDYIGCIGLRRNDLAIGEIKRMYVQPVARGIGLGKMLLEAATELARKIGYRYLRLDTLDSMHAAIKTYTSAGFYEIPAYYDNPLEGVRYFEKDLETDHASLG